MVRSQVLSLDLKLEKVAPIIMVVIRMLSNLIPEFKIARIVVVVCFMRSNARAI
jgi:hypothetical protein